MPDVLASGLAALDVLPLDDARLEVVLANDLEKSAGRRGRDGFRGPRRVATGSVMGMVVPNPDRVGVLIAGRLLRPGAVRAGLANVPRLFAHEGYHALLVQHAEHAEALLEEMRRQGVAGSAGLSLAAGMIEEYRVELPLCRAGLLPNPNLDRSLRGFARGLADAREATESERAEAWTRDLFGHLLDVVHRLARSAAADAVEDRRTAPPAITERKIWRRYFADLWEPVRDALEPVPAALDRMPYEEMAQTASAVGVLLEAWIERAGFAPSYWQDDGVDFVSFDVIDAEDEAADED